MCARPVFMAAMLTSAIWCQDSLDQRPAPQQPVPIKIEMPVVSVWDQFIAYGVPSLIVAAMSLFGVWLTNRTIAASRKADREFELRKLDQQFHREFKRDALMRIAQSLARTLNALKAWHDALQYLPHAQYGDVGPDEAASAEEDYQKAWREYEICLSELDQAVAASCLAVSDQFWRSVQSAAESIPTAQRTISSKPKDADRILTATTACIMKVTEEARHELQNAPVMEA